MDKSLKEFSLDKTMIPQTKLDEVSRKIKRCNKQKCEILI
jgi:hypothetical protein